MGMVSNSRDGEQIPSADNLDALAAFINEQHREAAKEARSAVERARQVGEALLRAKQRLGHGKFLPWLAANCEVKERQARNYMTLARGWDRLGKSAVDADLTITKAIEGIQGKGKPADEPKPLGFIGAALNDYGLPELNQGTVLTGINADADGTARAAFIVPIGGRYFHVSVITLLPSDDGHEDFTRRGVIDYAVPMILERMGFKAPIHWHAEPTAQWMLTPWNAALLANAADERRRHILGNSV